MTDSPTHTPFDIPAFLKSLTHKPGVYRMLNDQGEVIYVGKAKNLKKRVSSYFSGRGASPKQQAMVNRIRSIVVHTTHTEGEALLLESQLIKRFKPRYNISFRDDKSYPFIYVTTQQAFPRMTFHRGAKAKVGQYFGPFPSASSVRESLKLLQKVFRVRQCRDSFFENRSRPCLEYQIERCKAPCVGLIGEEAYAEDVRDSLMFLNGNGHQLIDLIANRMEKASQGLHFEEAARYRDQISNLRIILEKQSVHGEAGDVDLIACALKGAAASIQMVFIRGGQQIGDRVFFPSLPDEQTPSKILEAFIAQYYFGKPVAREILVSHPIENEALLEEVLSEQSAHSVKIASKLRGDRARRMQMAISNAETALLAKLANRQDLLGRYLELQSVLALPELPNRMECFDISHTSGEHTVASCVVFDRQGPVKSAYRRFNIEGIQPGDDYAAMEQAVRRRYQRIKAGEIEAPDLLFIDGGKGQVKSALKALDELGLASIRIIGIAKGPERKPGLEVLIPGELETPFMLPSHSPALLLIQQIRDEAHRFAITGHRQRRAKAKNSSQLDAIPGLGPKRRHELMRQFGGIREISGASVEALSRINGISLQLAQKIYDTFHDQDT